MVQASCGNGGGGILHSGPTPRGRASEERVSAAKTDAESTAPRTRKPGRRIISTTWLTRCAKAREVVTSQLARFPKDMCITVSGCAAVLGSRGPASSGGQCKATKSRCDGIGKASHDFRKSWMPLVSYIIIQGCHDFCHQRTSQKNPQQNGSVSTNGSSKICTSVIARSHVSVGQSSPPVFFYLCHLRTS